jgi:hypothetical protein
MTAELPPRPITRGLFLLVDGEWVDQSTAEFPEVLSNGIEPEASADGEEGGDLRGQPDGDRD